MRVCSDFKRHWNENFQQHIPDDIAEAFNAMTVMERRVIHAMERVSVAVDRARSSRTTDDCLALMDANNALAEAINLLNQEREFQ
jgi:hypothetical protein